MEEMDVQMADDIENGRAIDPLDKLDQDTINADQQHTEDARDEKMCKLHQK